MIEGKIQSYHISKQAYIYLRQSTMGQVRLNQESTQRQYDLQNKAQQMGWPQPSIKILDGDLGISGSQSSNREDFKALVADVSMGVVGAIFVLEASRLSRSCTDWHRLLELCAMTSTLIIDEDGCYNPSDFNDQLLLGLKGTMSFAELHFIRARLQGGKTNKAKKGELRFPLTIGFCYDERGRIKFDPDEQVKSILFLLFNLFREKGSAYGVSQYFNENNIQFPKRIYGTLWNGKLLWGSLTHSRVTEILKNPAYAGTYVYGRRKCQKKVSSEGRIQMNISRRSMENWPVMIHNHHEEYISWENYLENQEILKQNFKCREENVLPTGAREGLALLQGILICGFCGRRLLTRYQGNGGIYPVYFCKGEKHQETQKKGWTIAAKKLDCAISEKILEVVQPFQIEMAIKAFEELKQRNNELEKQWAMKIERANYEVQLARRRYEDVDSSNRLVAASLEKEWNDALIELEKIRSQYAEYQKQNALKSIDSKKENLLNLAQQLPLLWNSPSTCAKDRKRILRLLIKDITIKREKEKQKLILNIRWQGGAIETMEVPLPQKIWAKWRHSPDTVNKVRELANSLSDQQIAEQLCQEGLLTNKGNKFTVASIRKLRTRYNIPRFPNPEELSVAQVAEKFNVTPYVVRSWIKQKIVNARQIGPHYWIEFDAITEEKLKSLIKQSPKVLTSSKKLQKHLQRSVL